MSDVEYATPPAKRRRLSTRSSSQDELSELPLPPPSTRRRSSQHAIKAPDTPDTPRDNSSRIDEDVPDGEDELSHDLPAPIKSSTLHPPVAASATAKAAIGDVSSAPDSDYYTDPGASSPVPLPAQSPQPQPAPAKLQYKPKLILRGHKRAVTAVKFSPDGTMIASCSADATLRIWSAATGQPLHTLHGHLAGISTLAWSPSSSTLASGSDDKLIRLWSASTGKPHPAPLSGHHNYILSIAFSPKGNVLASGSADEAVHLWDVRSRRILRVLPAHGDPVCGVDFSGDGTLVASCAADGLVRVWDAGSGQCLRTFFHEDTPAVGGVRFCANARFVATWMLDGSVRLWDYVGVGGNGGGRARCVKTFLGHVNGRVSLVGAFGVYRVEGGAEAGKRRRGSMAGRALENGEDDDVHDEDGDVSTPKPAPDEETSKTTTTERAFLISGSEDGSIVLWDVVTKEILQRLPDGHQQGHTGTVFGVDVHPDPAQRALVSGGADGTVRVWRME